MKKVVITAFGDESELAISEGDIAPPGDDEVQIEIEYTVVTGSDVKMRLGTYPLQKKPPLTPGYSIVGAVLRNGARCTRFKVGDRVACLTKYDGQAELINQPECFLVPVPAGADPKQAVALVLDWVTAYEMLHRSACVKSGQRIFVHGMSGAVGQALLTLGRIAGAEVLGTASCAKLPALAVLDAVAFDYADKKWISAVQTLGGVDAVFDPKARRHLGGVRLESARFVAAPAPPHASGASQTVRQELVLLDRQANHVLRCESQIEKLPSGSAVAARLAGEKKDSGSNKRDLQT
jgi:NADPH:quinone reductase-like Zn-dependent oxidoreductase